MSGIRVFRLANGKEPFTEWREELNTRERVAVTRFILRVAEGGGKKGIKAVGEGVLEMKVPLGPGLRVYFGWDGREIILLLLGGDKSSQSRDIKKAKEYWRLYASRK